MKNILVALSLLSSVSHAFVPPVAQVLRDVFQPRKGAAAMEIVFRHQIKTPSGVVEVEEHFIGAKGTAVFLFRSEGTSVLGKWEKGIYHFPNDKRTSRSSLFNRYFIGLTGDDLKTSLIAEKFLRPEQLAQYKQGFNPTGDPTTWEVLDNYLVHPDISLKRLPTGVGIAVRGTDEGASMARTFYLDTQGRGVRRFEWVDGGASTTWTFDQFSAESPCPRRAKFEKAGEGELITTDVITCRGLKAKGYTDLVKLLKKDSAKNDFSKGEAVNLLLTYR